MSTLGAALVLRFSIESSPNWRIDASSFGDELRLLDDLEAHPGLKDEIAATVDDALEFLRHRAAFAVPGDLTAAA